MELINPIFAFIFTSMFMASSITGILVIILALTINTETINPWVYFLIISITPPLITGLSIAITHYLII